MGSVQRLFRSWSVPPRLTWLLVSIAAVLLAVEMFYAVYWRTNDYSVHRLYGLYFLEGEPFRVDEATAYYPVGRLWINAGFASVNYYFGRFLCYVLAVLSLGFSMRMWAELAEPAVPLAADRRVSAIGWTIAVLLPFLIRDLDECGLQLLLLFFLTAAGYAFAHGGKVQCGFWLGVAAVYKVTPLLFLPLLLWKREWKAAGWTVAFTLVLSLLPATYLGWNKTLEAHGTWFERTVQIVKNQEAYPSVPGIEEPKQQNVSLKALLARYLTSYPPGHPLFVDHPLFFQFGALSPAAGRRAVTGLTLLLGLAIAWRMRRRWSEPLANSNFAPEWAVACLFTALMSPLCWRQHLVMAIPCVYLAARERLSRSDGGWRKWVPVVAACIFILSRRELIGRELSHVLLTYKLDTFAVLAFALLCLTLPVALAQKSNEEYDSDPQVLPRAA